MLQPRLRSITSNFYICRMRSCLPNQKPVFLQIFLASLHSQMRVIGYSRLRPQCKCEDQYAKPRVEVLDSLEAPSFLVETCSVFLCTKSEVLFLRKILHHCIVRVEQHAILNWGSIANAWMEMLKPRPFCLRCLPLDELQFVCGACFLFCHVISTLWIEVFLECVQFPDMIHALKPNPKNHIQENWRIMDFFSNIPESCNMFTFLFDDIGIPADYRHMEGFGVHTFKVHFLASFSIEKQCLGKLDMFFFY